MDEIRKKREDEITAWLTGKTITGIKYYLMNRNTYLHPHSEIQLVDAGVQFELNGNEYVTFGWNFAFAILDMHAEKFVDKLRSYNDDMPYLEIEANEDAQWKNLLGSTITGVRFAWNWFTDIDDVTHFVPQDIELLLNDGKYVAVCTTAFKVDEGGIHITHPDSEGELLVLFNEEDTRFYKRGSYYEPQTIQHTEEEEANDGEEFF